MPRRNKTFDINANSSATLAVKRFQQAMSLNPVNTPAREEYREALMEDGRKRSGPGKRKDEHR